ncbi:MULTISPECIES: methylated-DNA--[protein]-cysteine S-methyltransferase [Enterococcus]|uniref:methylated-DNA--[protein]-cysteine S-methyltransferase n=1 Tax=Enterococcus TaxID=1350 RepID=UPI0010F647F3|nr:MULTISPECIES: methylated-DNA--[protein]-cysteine S-methyltransferase [Enterococcus]KAF1303427.1 hypothetical protein BAU16_05085 [Enterococcus sp. JM9B]
MNKLFYEIFPIEETNYLVASTEKGVAYLGLEEDIAELAQFFKGYQAIPEAGHSQAAIQQLTEYFAGERQNFDLIYDFVGTSFQQKVWRELVQVPFGKVETYSELAKKVGNEKGVRAVANAVGRNPLMVVVPCHRIVGKNGTFTGYRGGIPLKKRLLAHEGVTTIKE